MDRALRDRDRQPRRALLNADPTAQLRLLDLQALDSRLDQLALRRDRLPQIAELEALVAEHRSLSHEAIAAEAAVAELTDQQAKADAEVELVRTRRRRDQQRLDDGQVGSAKELQSLQSEVESLTRRQADLEERELEVMQGLEDAETTLTGLQRRRADVAERGVAARTARDEARREIDSGAETARGERDVVAEEVPDGLRELYDKLRASIAGGIAAAALYRGSCGGCRIQLSPTDLARFRSAAADEVLRCDDCRRILVRTAESGL